MTGVRRYSDAEVSRIFEEAAALAGQRQQSSETEGLTLAELQDIAREVGLPADNVAAAARALDVETPLPRRRHFGLPVGVGHVVELDRPLSDQEWEIFVAEVRRTFGAAGRDRSTPVVRHWSNGNLHVFIEPTEIGARLRMGTYKGQASAANWLGFSWTLAGGTFLIASQGALLLPTVPMVFVSLGFGAFLSNFLRLPTWAKTRETQMLALGRLARSMVARTAALEGPRQSEPLDT